MFYYSDLVKQIKNVGYLSARTLNRHSMCTKEYKCACFLLLVYCIKKDDYKGADALYRCLIHR